MSRPSIHSPCLPGRQACLKKTLLYSLIFLSIDNHRQYFSDEKDYEEQSLFIYFPRMKIKPPILSIAVIIHIIYSISYYTNHGIQNDHEGWGKLATLVLVEAGFAAIVVDVILHKRLKTNTTYMIIASLLLVIGYILFYKL